MNSKPKLNILYTNIGRGHPFYLDGLVEQFQTNFSEHIEAVIKDVFSISGGLSQTLWKFARYLYRAGSQGGLIGSVYGAIRRGRNPEKTGITEKILARDIRKYVKMNSWPTLVAHPILVQMIADLVPVYYQHGEIAVPEEAIIKGAREIYVPLLDSSEAFEKSSRYENNVFTSGLCIEDKLRINADRYFQQRLSRIEKGSDLIGGFFSSGAEPLGHAAKIAIAVNSLVKTKNRCIVLCRSGGLLEETLEKGLHISAGRDYENISEKLESETVVAVSFSNRYEENEITCTIFEYLDYFVAPSHERTNWAVGLGLPMFILHPLIGTFAPLNRNFLIKQGVAIDLDSDKSASRFAELLSKVRGDGILYSMAQNGFGKFEMDGFHRIAGRLVNCLESRGNIC